MFKRFSFDMLTSIAKIKSKDRRNKNYPGREREGFRTCALITAGLGVNGFI